MDFGGRIVAWAGLEHLGHLLVKDTRAVSLCLTRGRVGVGSAAAFTPEGVVEKSEVLGAVLERR